MSTVQFIFNTGDYSCIWLISISKKKFWPWCWQQTFYRQDLCSDTRFCCFSHFLHKYIRKTQPHILRHTRSKFVLLTALIWKEPFICWRLHMSNTSICGELKGRTVTKINYTQWFKHLSGLILGLFNDDFNPYPANVENMVSSHQCYKTAEGI